MTTLFINITGLVGCTETPQLLRGAALKSIEVINGAFLLIKSERIAAYGSMADIEAIVPEQPAQTIDATGRYILPAWCDSHTHLIFPKSREGEFVQKIQGKSYAEIAASGGGILNSANMLQGTAEDELFGTAIARLAEVAKTGTGAIEIKSGYGLSVEGELKMLRVIKRLKEHSDLLIKGTFLAAHAYPQKFKADHQGYINSIIDEMLPVIANEGLADFVDVFCEDGFFSVAEMEQICEAALKHNLKPKLHVNQLNSIGGLQAAIQLNALSVDHLETMTTKDIEDLATSSTIGTLLPTAAFFLRMPYQPARKLIDGGAALAIASDYNPGSSPSGNMNFVVALSCIQMQMLPEEAINAATINGAYAMEVERDAGSITVGKLANLILTRPMPSLAYLPYSFGENLVENTMIRGKFLQ